MEHINATYSANLAKALKEAIALEEMRKAFWMAQALIEVGM